jgi:transcriptional regulator with XRE-family HTH domain
MGFSAIADRVREIREGKGLSQRKLSDLLKKGPTYVQQLEGRGHPMGSEVAVRMAKVLGVRLEWLLTGEGEP